MVGIMMWSFFCQVDMFFLSFFLFACFLFDSIDHFPVDDFYKIHDHGHIEIIYYLEQHYS